MAWPGQHAGGGGGARPWPNGVGGEASGVGPGTLQWGPQGPWVREPSRTPGFSATGSSMLTEVSGASEVFEAGFVTYSNSMKSQLINVKKETLEKYGAVNEAVAKEMLLGALNTSKADYGVAVSGVAGPNGGTEEKPVGTVCIAWGSKDENTTTTLLMPRSRSMFQLMVAATGMDLIRRQIVNIKSTPRYFGRTVITK